MPYLSRFYFTSAVKEEAFINKQRLTCYDSYYPFGLFPKKELKKLEFADVTILYGSNGSGKTTALNVIAEKLGAERVAPYNRTDFFGKYLESCEYEDTGLPKNVRFIASDDVFDYMLDVRQLNENIDAKRTERFQEYMDLKYAAHKTQSLEDVNELRFAAKSRTLSKFTRMTLIDNVREYSNGESAFRYFAKYVEENGLYLLDEPENSLSPEMQLELVKFLEDSVRFCGCQLIIATHSPFILSMKGAKVYDMDRLPVAERDWHALKNMQIYYDFFLGEEEAFENAKDALRLEALAEKEAENAPDDGLNSAQRRLKSQLQERSVAGKDAEVLVGMLAQPEKANALTAFLIRLNKNNPDAFRTEKGIRELTATLFEEALRLYKEE